MSNLTDVLASIERQGEEFAEQFKRLDALEAGLDAARTAANRPRLGGEAPAQRETWYDVKSGRRIPVLAHGDSLAALESASAGPSIGRFLRGIICGGRADDAAELAQERKALAISPDPSGGYTVGGSLASRWIDLLRAEMVLSRAGATTVPMDTKTLTIARLTADPTVSWRAENAALAGSDPTFGAVNLSAKTVACLVKMSLELSQDSVNIEQILQGTLTSSLAHAIDKAGLVGETTDAAAAPSGIFDLAGRNQVTSIGAPTSWDFVVDGMYELAADNVPLDSIGALIGHPALWKKMRKLKTGLSGDNSPLAAPAEVAALPKLWTTAAPQTKAILARWADLLFGVRKDITLRVLTEAFMGSNLQLAVLAYARVDFVAAREASFCTMEGITVS